MTAQLPPRPAGGLWVRFCDLTRTTALRVTCTKCSRTGRYSIARLVAQHGREAALSDFLDLLRADCPRAAAALSSDACRAAFASGHKPPFVRR